ncbi:hypothetical protein [Sanyastnella coralliicola]|uniref:hypothetical protein n=1 Tax=Sanyastnella coralliicola TaxID=3069118 RepID=UPI0027BA2551|nr:hypothetical protein [Longitalea sp. SCSIO 12813]
MEVLRQEGASCMDGFIARAGQLTLTKKELCFEFKGGDEVEKPICISLDDIDKVDYFKSLSIIPNGLTLFLRSGELTHFVVDDRKSWQEALLKATRLGTK